MKSATSSAEERPPCYVLDSFALIAYLEDEPGAARVEELLRDAADHCAMLFLCIVNYGEVLYITEREQSQSAARAVITTMDHLPLQIIEADRALTFAAAHIKAHHPIAYADAFAVALAQRKDATLVTGDPELRHVEHLITIEWLPEG